MENLELSQSLKDWGDLSKEYAVKNDEVLILKQKISAINI